MDQVDLRPTKVFYLYKYKDQTMDQWVKTGVEGVIDYDTDTGSATGTQNIFKLSNIPYRSAVPEVDIFAVGVTANNDYYSPGFWATSIAFTVKESGGIDTVQTSFEILAPKVATTLSVYDHLETPSGEIMRIEGITPGSPNYTLQVERGAHATTASSVLENAEVELLSPRTGMERITLAGDTTALAAPVLDSATGISSAVELHWSHSYTGDSLKRLDHWRVYYDTSSSVDPDASNTPDYIEVHRDFLTTSFTPILSARPNPDQLYYFVVTAITKAGQESPESNELSAKPFGSFQPEPGGPVTPTVTVEVNGSYRLKVEAKKPTLSRSVRGVMNVKKATIAVYYATTGLGNPTTGAVDGNQTLIGSYDDESVPYSVELGVSATGYKDYWARAKFIDGDDQDSGWAVSTVFELNAENNTTDTGIPTGVAVAVLVDEINPFRGDSKLVVGITSTGNNDSADQCQIAWRVDDEGTFAAGDTLPFTGATNTKSTPKTFGGYPAVFPNEVLQLDRKWEVTVRIHNNYGWSNWITPEAITFSGTTVAADTTVCALAQFGAWTQDSEHPDVTSAGVWPVGVPEPGGEQVTFTFGMPAANRSTVWNISVEGTKSASFPTETVRIDEGDGTLVAVPGGLTATVTGSSATLNQYADEFLRIGIDPGKNATDILQVFQILSNTSGNPFTMTMKGNSRIRNIDPAGGVAAWQIVEKAIWSLVDYYTDISLLPEQLGTVPSRKSNFLADVTGMKFRARAHNIWGLGAYRYSDATAFGTATAGSVIYKIIGGIDSGDLKDGAIIEGKIGTGAVTEGKLGAGSVTAAKLTQQTLPIGHDITFTATDYRSFSWAAGDVYYANGTSDSIGGSSSGNLSTNTDYWVSFDPGSPGGGLTITTSVETALENGKVIIAIAHTTSVVDEFCTIIPRWGSGINIGAQNIVCENLSAISANFGTMTAGTINGVTIQTSATAAANGGIVLNATTFKLYDSAGEEAVELSEANGLRIYDSGGNTALDIVDGGSRLGYGRIGWHFAGTLAGAIHAASATNFTVTAEEDLVIVSDNFNMTINNLRAGLNAGLRGKLAAAARTVATANAGLLELEAEDGDSYFFWVDTAGNFRGHTSDPGADDTLGVVIADLSP